MCVIKLYCSRNLPLGTGLAAVGRTLWVHCSPENFIHKAIANVSIRG